MSVPDPALHDWVPIYASGPAPISYSTTLPANPIDGQEAILVDSITNPSYQWRFRYNAQSISAYKWEFVGGTPFKAFGAGGSLTTTSTAANVPGSALITVPKAGEYNLQVQGLVASGVPSGAHISYIDVTPVAECYWSGAAFPSNTTTYTLTLAGFLSLNAGTILRLRAWVVAGAGISWSFSRHEMYLQPMRVS